MVTAPVFRPDRIPHGRIVGLGAVGEEPGPASEPASTAAHVVVDNVNKRFGGALALNSVSLAIERGTVHALVGENGAGKSTLGKLIAGVHSPDGGQVLVNGRPVSYRTPHDALADRITIVAQELALVPARSVMDNVFLGIEPSTGRFVDRGAMRRRFDDLVGSIGFDLRANDIVGGLAVAEQQKVEIMRALARGAELIVMDEPTAALSLDETTRLLDVIRRLRDGGTTVVFVSHFLEEVLSLADNVSVLKDGRHVRSGPAADETPASLVMSMLGRSLQQQFPPKHAPALDAPVVLSVDGLRRTGVLDDVTIQIRAGEIVGLAGLVGSGRSEVARAIFGVDKVDDGVVRLHGRRLPLGSTRRSVRAGIAMLPESRKDQGLLLGRSVGENLTLAHLREFATGGMVRSQRERAAQGDLVERLDIRSTVRNGPVGQLSGGNQQKVLFGKWLAKDPAVFLIDEPTRGVDVGAKYAIHALIAGLAARGIAVLVISSEIEEVLGLAHRVLAMRSGRVVAEFTGPDFVLDEVMSAVFGLDPPSPPADQGEA